MIGFRKTLAEHKYRMNLRANFANATNEELSICKEEIIKEQERRRSKKKR